MTSSASVIQRFQKQKKPPLILNLPPLNSGLLNVKLIASSKEKVGEGDGTIYCGIEPHK